VAPPTRRPVNDQPFLKRGTGAKLAKGTAKQGPSKSAEECQAELKQWLATKPPFRSDNVPNAFCLALGQTASKELRDFVSVFEPLAANTTEGSRLREEGFRAADPNGNGLCSLSELDTFVKLCLVTKFPNTGKGKERKTPGEDLWKAFRPCYIRAFKVAADYAKDDGETIAGTKNAKQDDFVSNEEFSFFLAYVCIYASMVSTQWTFLRALVCLCLKQRSRELEKRAVTCVSSTPSQRSTAGARGEARATTSAWTSGSGSSASRT
jgi:hypothetical protein